MILFIPGGFILGGMTAPTTFFADWVVKFSHVFPLTWEFHFERDIIARGAGFFDITQTFGAFLVYMGIVGILFCLRFNASRKELLARKAGEERQQRQMEKLAKELAE
jgi:ABC-2 type transport system permease protein